MLCEQLGVVENYCVHRSRYTCYPPNGAPTPSGVLIGCTAGRSVAELREDFARPTTGERCVAVPLAADFVVDSQGNADNLLPSENCVPYWSCNNDLRRFFIILVEGESDNTTKEALKKAAKLACCLVKQFNLFDPDGNALVYPYGQIDSTKCLRRLPSTFWSYFSACITGEIDFDDYTPATPPCCEQNRESIHELERLIDRLTRRVEALEQRPDLTPIVDTLRLTVDGLQSRLINLEQNYTSLQTQIAQLAARFTVIEQCFNKLPQCKEDAPPCQIVYQLRNVMRVTPLVARRIDFDTRISDDNPPIVTTGMWRAQIGDGENARIWAIEGEIRIRPRKWCQNKGVRVYFVDCDGNRIQVAQWIAPSHGAQPAIMLNWSFNTAVQTGQTCFVHFEVESDDTTEPFFEIEYGQIKMSR